MSEQNKAVIRRFYEEVLNEKSIDAMNEFCADDIVDHSPMPRQAPGLRAVKEMFRMIRWTCQSVVCITKTV